LRRALAARREIGGGRDPRSRIRGRVDPSLGGGPESYRLVLGPGGAELTAGGPAGLFYAAQTLAQCLAAAPAGRPELRLPGLVIDDAPALAGRGVLLDVSRNKVPTLATLFELVDRLASLKINQLQLYMEHTFAYPGHEPVWRGASPLTAEEVRRLDRHCAERHVELVPNQNSFGHFHRWLVHPRYRHLAERPDGVQHPFSDVREPFSLCPVDPRSLELLEELYDELLPNFTSGQLHVGFDETFDLGTGRSAAACAERGRGRVRLEFLRQVHRLAAGHGRRIQFWADGLLEQPELIAELPADATAVVWRYEAGAPFGERCRPFADAGRPFAVCAGTSSWISFAGRWRNALVNVAEAAAAARATGAGGLLIADWGDLGHLQPLVAAWPGLLAGAEAAWRGGGEGPGGRPWPELLDRHLFLRPGYGAVLRRLGEAHLATGVLLANGTVLGRLVLSHRDRLVHPRYQRLRLDGLAAAAAEIDAALRELAALPHPGDEPAGDELAWTGRALAFAARLGEARLRAGRKSEIEHLPSAARRDLRALLDPLVEELPGVWLSRNRPGGLADSRRRLTTLAARLGAAPTPL
ncbi:MAG: family 20 glycosylhydrolase, partial [Thermoanaerobaculia bacterium]|nr:family 20 glycosylhydrolase [Thermoanaerobaculia bacterium]